MMHVITGSQSFIGSCLKKKLGNLDIDYVGIDALQSSDQHDHQVDITSKELADFIPSNAEAIIHLAAISRDQDCKQDLQRAFSINVNGTINLLEAAATKGVQHFVFASSEWIYGEVKNDGIQREDDVVCIQSLDSEYAITKLIGEQMIKLSAQKHGMKATILRFGIVYGPRENNWSAVEHLFHAVRDHDEVTIGSRKTARRFVYVEDIANGICKSLERKGEGFEIYNLSGSKLVTLEEIIRESNKIWGKDVRIIEKNSENISIRNPDPTKARTELNWESKFSLEEGLKCLNERSDICQKQVA